MFLSIKVYSLHYTILQDIHYNEVQSPLNIPKRLQITKFFLKYILILVFETSTDDYCS